LPELVADVQERKEEGVVTKNGRPAAILINIDESARLKETLDVWSDPALLKQINRSQAFYRSGKNGLTFETCLVSPSLPSRSVALRESSPSGYPAACG